MRAVWLLALLWLPPLAGAFDYPPELQRQLQAALQSRPPDYRPRTRNWCDGQPCYTNRLILENSPYLLQHAHNPVDWYPWGAEAFDKARRENKPVFLSIGYAACHWCHVMEEESFDNPAIAAILNRHFVAIKVDRERRPDLDDFFAGVVMRLQGQQGWPMSVFLTPEGKPFAGGGYYPPDEFRALLSRIQADWSKDAAGLRRQARELLEELRAGEQRNTAGELFSDDLRKQALRRIYSIFDSYHGGFGEASKFPREPWLLLFLDDSFGAAPDSDSLNVLRTTLTHMALGGIHDQIGGGFHRYTTDPFWQVPHFEKMLYDQALLARLYLWADVVRADPWYRRVARQTLDFMLDELASPEGAFYASLDADSAGEEGSYYLWRPAEFRAALPAREARFAAELFDVDDYGEVGGANVLYLREVPPVAQWPQLDRIRQRLKQARERRAPPARDEKILLGWNALAITALAEGAYLLEQPRYLNAAARAAEFIWQRMRNEAGFFRSYFHGHAEEIAQLKDHAFYLQALISLYDLQQDGVWLQRAETVLQLMQQNFADPDSGAFFPSRADAAAPVPVRTRSAFDRILPSGNAVAAQMLVRLARRRDDPALEKSARALLAAFADDVREVPSAHAGLLIAAHELREGQRPLPVYAARGHARVDAVIRPLADDRLQLRIELQLAEGWHVNSHAPLEDYLIPTRIDLAGDGWRLEEVRYPPARRLSLAFSRTPLALYLGRTRIGATLRRVAGQWAPVVRLHLQACNNSLCLPPETLTLYPRRSLKQKQDD